jgi:hypothetical protein
MSSKQELESFLQNKAIKFVKVGQKCTIMIVLIDGTELYTSVVTDFASHFFEDVDDVFNANYASYISKDVSCKLSLTNDSIRVDLEYIFFGKKVSPVTEKLSFKLEKKATVDSNTLSYDFMDVKQRLKRKRIYEDDDEEDDDDDDEEDDDDDENIMNASVCSD